MKRTNYSIDLQLKLHIYISLVLFLLSELREKLISFVMCK